MKTGYITDDFSTLGGLAAVAYGDPEYFREVQNQIYSSSVTRFLDTQRPSDIFESFFGTKESFMAIVLKSLEFQYSANNSFTDYVDIEFGPDWREKVARELKTAFFESLDSMQGYGLTTSDYVEFAISTVMPGLVNPNEVVLNIVATISEEPGVGPDSNLISRLVSNNPQTKISVPPPNSRIDLESSVDLGSDYRGVDFSMGYVSPGDYWNNIAFPGLTSTVIPTNLKDSIIAGYTGYLSFTPLEALYNPVGASSISNAPSGTSVPTSSILSQFPENLQADNEIYAISLMGEKLNGYTTFDPQTMSNGDLIDLSLVPTYEEDNKDPQGGLPSSSRNFTPAF